MKKLFTLLSLTFFSVSIHSQNTAVRLCDFDTVKHIVYKESSGNLDTNFTNPMTTGLNSSAKCALYIRDTATYDNIHFHAVSKFVDISAFAQANTPSKISMMVMSKMPVGSKIDIQLGSRAYNSYPGGIHSVYTGTTTLQNQWELIVFNLSTNLSSSNGFPYPGSIDKMIILFNTNAHTHDTIYFDEVMGPAIEKTNGIAESDPETFSLYQNSPNPAGSTASISFELKAREKVSLRVFDILGKEIGMPLDSELDAGAHSVNIDTGKMDNGIYFYTLRAGDRSATRRMVVSR